MGKFSKLRAFSSPVSPRSWPARMRAAVTVEMPMPSPTNRMTLRALPLLLLARKARFRATVACPSSYQVSGDSCALTQENSSEVANGNMRHGRELRARLRWVPYLELVIATLLAAVAFSAVDSAIDPVIDAVIDPT